MAEKLSPFAHRAQLVSGFIAAAIILVYLIMLPGSDERELSTLQKIQKRGQLKVLTLNSATTYYQDIDGANGFEYQLASWFAESIGVEALFTPVTYAVVNGLKRVESEDFYDTDTNFTPFSLQD